MRKARRAGFTGCLVAALVIGAVGCSSDGSSGSGGSAGSTTTAAPTASAKAVAISATPPTSVPVLGVVNAGGGTFADGTLTLTDVQPYGAWFTDRPGREAGTSTIDDVISTFFDRDDPPNAAVEIAGAQDGADVAIVELTDPEWDAATRTLTVSAKAIPDVDADRLAAHPGLAGYVDRNDGELPAEFSASAVFLDSGMNDQTNTPVVQDTPDAADVAQLAATYETVFDGLRSLLDGLRYDVEVGQQDCMRWLTQSVSNMNNLLTVAQPQVKDLQRAVADNDGVLPASEAMAYDEAAAYLQTEVTGLQQLQVAAQAARCAT